MSDVLWQDKFDQDFERHRDMKCASDCLLCESQRYIEPDYEGRE
jgi:hypothetical protein